MDPPEDHLSPLILHSTDGSVLNELVSFKDPLHYHVELLPFSNVFVEVDLPG